MGVHPSEAMMHFPLFKISPLFPKIFSHSVEISQFYLFPQNIPIFIRQNLMTLFF